jgi:hypothetical protein
MREYNVINLGNDGNEEDGYTVGSAHYTGKQVVLEHPTLEHAVSSLRRYGFLSDLATTETVTHHENEIGTDSQSITLRDKQTGLYLFELRPLAP